MVQPEHEPSEDLISVLGEAVRSALNAAENAAPAQAVEAVTKELAAALGATSVSLLIADLSGRALVRLTQEQLHAVPSPDGTRRSGSDRATALPLDGGPAEQALRTQTVGLLPPGDAAAAGSAPGRWTALAPISERGDIAGLLELSLPRRPDPAVVDEIAKVAHLLGFVLIAARRHTDLFEWGQRTTPYTLSAEIQRRLLPPAFTCEGGPFTLSAWLEPAASAGGDTFDYSVGRTALRLSITDAMGHGVAAALAATLCVGSLRGTRRAGGGLLQQAQAANLALADHAGEVATDIYVTGLLADLDLDSGLLTLVNAGHVRPYLAPADGSPPQQLALPADLPFGLFATTAYRTTRRTLEPGDRLVFVTDGMLERNAAQLDMPAAIISTRQMHPREATRHLADQVLLATGGSLSDDATLMLLDWHGRHHDRTSTSGLDPAASTLPETSAP